MVSESIVNIDTSQLERFNAAVRGAIEDIGDLTVPYNIMTKSWFQGNKSMFILKSNGRHWDDLKASTKKSKARKYGEENIYPILRASGKLEKSITNPQDNNSVNYIINKKYLFLGTKAQTKKGFPYAVALQTGTKRMAGRPYVLIGNEQVATKQDNERLEAWITTLNDYVFNTLSKRLSNG